MEITRTGDVLSLNFIESDLLDSNVETIEIKYVDHYGDIETKTIHLTDPDEQTDHYEDLSDVLQSADDSKAFSLSDTLSQTATAKAPSLSGTLGKIASAKDSSLSSQLSKLKGGSAPKFK